MASIITAIIIRLLVHLRRRFVARASSHSPPLPPPPRPLSNGAPEASSARPLQLPALGVRFEARPCHPFLPCVPPAGAIARAAAPSPRLASPPSPRPPLPPAGPGGPPPCRAQPNRCTTCCTRASAGRRRRMGSPPSPRPSLATTVVLSCHGARPRACASTTGGCAQCAPLSHGEAACQAFYFPMLRCVSGLRPTFSVALNVPVACIFRKPT